ncbi:unnamed protein product [Aphanomyces euteiches]
MVILAQNAINLAWHSIRLLLVPDVFLRFFVATVSLQALFEVWTMAKRFGLRLALQCTANGRKRLKLRTAMENARSLAEQRVRSAKLAEITLDRLLDKSWMCSRDMTNGKRILRLVSFYTSECNRKLPCISVFNVNTMSWESCLLCVQVFCASIGDSEILGSMVSVTVLEPSCNICTNFELVGTKHVVDEYMDTVLSSMDMVLQSRHDSMTLDVTKEELSVDNKLAFFSETRHAYGRSALMLSGGGGLGLYHTGIVKTLFEEGMLPTVISGASAGSIVAGCIGVRTDEELAEIFRDGYLDLFFFEFNVTPRDLEMYTPSWLAALEGILPTSTFESLQEYWVIAARFQDQGYFLDTARLKQNLRNNMGDYTFREAYDRTGRIINITVTPSQTTDYPQLLNYLTAPNVLIWSASLASCAIPLVFAPVELYGKDQHGHIVPVYREGLKWSDGSVECDLPMERLSELFNVNHFIVSQVNIHYKFISGYESLGGGDLLGFLKKQMKAYIKNIAEFGLNTSVLKLFGVGLVPLLTQTYEGDITISIASQVSFLQMVKQVLTNPSPSHFHELVLAGERSVWPHLSRIRAMCRVEFALERAVRYLRGEQALEDEKRTGVSSLGRVPSFYTSPSSMNLSSMTQSPSTSRKTMPTRTEQPIRRNKSINVAGAVMNMESVLSGFGARHGASFE